MISLYYEVPEATRESLHIFRVVSYILSISQLAIEKPGRMAQGSICAQACRLCSGERRDSLGYRRTYQRTSVHFF